MDYRHELKFLVSDIDLEIIRYRLLPLMDLDTNQNGSLYLIRSLYFDDLNDSFKRESEDGIDNRSKYRIRLYNGDDSFIRLEKKTKLHGMTRKESAVLSRDECLQYMGGRCPSIRNDDHQIKKELYCLEKMRGMYPKSIVEYERTAFVEKKGNVRITFDRNLSGSGKVDSFLDKAITTTPLLPKGQHILEVKYDELLPQYIARVLQIGTLHQISFSKYYYSRNYVQ